LTPCILRKTSAYLPGLSLALAVVVSEKLIEKTGRKSLKQGQTVTRQFWAMSWKQDEHHTTSYDF
jgi:hypothetical protein